MFLYCVGDDEGSRLPLSCCKVTLTLPGAGQYISAGRERGRLKGDGYMFNLQEERTRDKLRRLCNQEQSDIIQNLILFSARFKSESKSM